MSGVILHAFYLTNKIMSVSKAVELCFITVLVECQTWPNGQLLHVLGCL